MHLATVSACTAPGLQQESLECNGTRTFLLDKPSPNPDDAGPIVHHPMGLLDSNPESLVAQLALRCSALDHCTTREPFDTTC